MAWEVKKLGEFLKLEYGKPLDKSKRKLNGKYPVYGANGEKGRSDEYYYDKPSIIVGRKGSAGEINLTEEKFWPLDVTYFVTFDNKKYDLYFIYHLLSGLNLPSLAKGVKPGINRNEVYSINVRLPPLSEQKRIIAILDGAFKKISKAKENAEKNLKNAKEIFESYLQSVFENKGEGWEEKSLENVCDELFAGGDVPKNNFSKFKTDNFSIPIFSNGVKDKGLYGFTNRSRVTKPSITISARGTIGYSEIRKEDYFPVVRLIVVIPNDNLIDIVYLNYMIGSLNFSNTGSSIPQLTVPMVKKYKILVPPLHEQKKIVSKLDSLSEEIKKLKKIFNQKLLSLEELKQSILKKAFKGELLKG